MRIHFWEVDDAVLRRLYWLGIRYDLDSRVFLIADVNGEFPCRQ